MAKSVIVKKCNHYNSNLYRLQLTGYSWLVDSFVIRSITIIINNTKLMSCRRYLMKMTMRCVYLV